MPPMLIYGSHALGFTFIGPFASNNDADAFAQDKIVDFQCEIAPLEYPSDSVVVALSKKEYETMMTALAMSAEGKNASGKSYLAKVARLHKKLRRLVEPDADTQKDASKG